MRCTLSANAGACLSPKDELAQEHERITHVQIIENGTSLCRQVLEQRESISSIHYTSAEWR